MSKRLELNREKRQQNRFKIVNLSRSQKQEVEDDVSSSELTILDVEKDLKGDTKTVATTSEENPSASYSDISEEAFVYDIYISDGDKVTSSDSFEINDLR